MGICIMELRSAELDARRQVGLGRIDNTFLAAPLRPQKNVYSDGGTYSREASIQTYALGTELLHAILHI